MDAVPRSINLAASNSYVPQLPHLLMVPNSDQKVSLSTVCSLLSSTMLKCGSIHCEKMRTTKLEPRFMSMAWDVAQHSNCRRRKVGVTIVRDGAVVITAANGTPAGMTPCNEGGCLRCLSDAPSGELYDSCLCIHAEQVAIARATRTGVPTDGATLYCTLRPCLTCVKLCLEAGISKIVYDEEIQFTPDVEEAYKQFTKETGLSFAKCPKGGPDRSTGTGK